MKWITWNAALMLSASATANAVTSQEEMPPAPPAGEPIVRPVGTSEVSVSEFGMVDVVAQNDYVTNILQKLAIQGRRNIVPSQATERLVSVNIYGIPFDDALTGLLEPNGLGWVQQGEFIYVYTAEELGDLQVGEFGAITQVIHLDYMRAVDAKDYVQGMLSKNGTIEVTKDFPEGKEDQGGEAAEGAIGGQVSDDNNFYSPDEDEYDLRNAIVVHDLPERVAQIEAFLEEADTRPAQVLIEASIVQTSLTEANAFGVDFALLSGENFIDFFQPPNSDNALNWQQRIDPVTGDPSLTPPDDNSVFALGTPGNTGVGDATIRAGIVSDVGIFLRALDQVTDVTLLSNPKVLTLNRQRTKVFVGTRIGYTETTTVNQQISQTIKFIDTGIVLDVRPFVLADGRVRLELSPKVSQVSFRNIISPGGATQQIPDEQIQTVTADILVPAGHTAVIGGLFREDMERSRDQVPFLGDLPFIGPMFQGRDETLRQTEVIFLIKPIVMQDEDVIAAGRAADEYSEDIRVGSRLGLLWWSRERHSARLNFEAERLLAKGETSAARSRLRQSLGMFPQQPDVVRALERLDREELWIRDLSYVNQLIDEEYERAQEEQGE